MINNYEKKNRIHVIFKTENYKALIVIAYTSVNIINNNAYYFLLFY